jgi:adenine/guanine phosphoribosyltransferase-like PRPP-binding protein
MKKRISVGRLIQRLNGKILDRLDISKSLVLGVVLKGLPVAYRIAKANHVIDNFVPIVAHRPLQFQHYVNSYFPSPEWKAYLQERLERCENLIVIDDVVNSGFTKQRLESIMVSLTKGHQIKLWFAALILNRKNLASPSFVDLHDIFALRVNAKEVGCNWGAITIPLWGLSIDKARQACEDYLKKHWLNEQRFVTITY